MISHHYPDCTGNWKAGRIRGDTQAVQCDKCRRAYPPTPSNWLEAIDENYVGRTLQDLTEQGERFLTGGETSCLGN
jgi:hypothetical protein